MNTTEETSYIPGVCNINMVEVAYRRKWRNIGLISAAILFVLLYATDANQLMRIFVFLPLFIGVIGYYQTKHRFCVSYGASGLQNAKPGGTQAATVTSEQAKIDRAFAKRLNSRAAVISVVITAILVLVPNL